jgi:alpha/beta superfamily hydrolase
VAAADTVSAVTGSPFRPPTPERVTIAGPAGPIEALVEVPEGFDGRAIAVVCHPHPLFGGTMQNKVVHMTARALQETGMATLRFNFRGVGASAGSFDDGRGETDDAVAACDYALTRWPGSALTLAGFSFGSFVAFKVASRRPAVRLYTIAPPVKRFDFDLHPVPSVPWTVIQGDRDELVDHDAVVAWAAAARPAPTLVTIQGGEHFFHGRLNELMAAVKSGVDDRG